jgi:hypothetical protein
MSKEDDITSIFNEKPDEILEMARHLRECEECRPKLLDEVRSYARSIRDEVSKDLGRTLTKDEEKTLARVVLVNYSISKVAMRIFTQPNTPVAMHQKAGIGEA